jgi:hypothetical protein
MSRLRLLPSAAYAPASRRKQCNRRLKRLYDTRTLNHPYLFFFFLLLDELELLVLRDRVDALADRFG